MTIKVIWPIFFNCAATATVGERSKQRQEESIKFFQRKPKPKNLFTVRPKELSTAEEEEADRPKGRGRKRRSKNYITLTTQQLSGQSVLGP